MPFTSLFMYVSSEILSSVRSEVFTSVLLKIRYFWHVTGCRLVLLLAFRQIARPSYTDSLTCLGGDRGITVVKVLCHKLEGRWFDPSWCQWIFH